ncbi:Ubiquitin-like_domain [Hexamita inflata]|uniref:Ubiquitin-like domain n=1 Tax=Hexamita inflata TaxID=28002 RepID=A0AA86QQE0_9EUKA|nr:Ubiquitin-like domain [Hexamita inflata]
MQINLQDIRSRSTTPVTIRRDSTVKEVINEVARDKNIDPKYIRLLYQTAILSLEQNISDLNLNTSSQLYISVDKRATLQQNQQVLANAKIQSIPLPKQPKIVHNPLKEFENLNVYFDEKFILETIRNSKILKKLGEIDPKFKQFVNDKKAATQVCELVNDAEKLKEFNEQKEKIRLQMLQNEEENQMLSGFQMQYQKACQMALDENDGMSIQNTLRSEVEGQFKYDRELKIIMDLGLDVQEETVKMLLTSFEGDVGFVMEEIYKMGQDQQK